MGGAAGSGDGSNTPAASSQKKYEGLPPSGAARLNQLKMDDRVGASNGAARPESESPEVAEETFYVQYRKGGLFQQWVNVVVVVDEHSIRKYPDEKRSAKRCKEILMYDAVFSVAVRRDSEA